MMRLILSKMGRNPWLVGCLLAGSIVAVSMVASIPLYTAGILQRMLTRDLEDLQQRTGIYPGRYLLSARYFAYATGETDVGDLAEQDRILRSRLIPAVGMPVLAQVNHLECEFLEAVPAAGQGIEETAFSATLEAYEGLESHVRIVQGRGYEPLPDAAEADLEAIVSEQDFAYNLSLQLDQVYEVTEVRGHLQRPLRVRITGVFTAVDSRDAWWSSGIAGGGGIQVALVADYQTLRRIATDAATPLLTRSEWSVSFDYHALRVGRLRRIMRIFAEQARLFDQYSIDHRLAMGETLQSYLARERTLTSTLWFLQIPVLLMLALYVTMVNRFLVEADRNDIAVMKSRGARTGQIFALYLAESALFALGAFLLGPPLGLFVCRVIGATNGFMEFVQRPALPLTLDGRTYRYAALCAVLLVATMLAPAWHASRTTIVLHKQSMTRRTRAPAWQRYFLDLAFLALAGYGTYVSLGQRTLLKVTALEAADLPIQPLSFAISTFFILGVGLLFIRLYPLLLRLLFRLGQPWWPPGMYATLLEAARGGTREQFLMLFLIMTLAVGVLNANTARTINRNEEDRIAYTVGADVTLQESWPGMTAAPTGMTVAYGAPSSTDDPIGRPPEYPEPDFTRFTSLAGVGSATKVFRRSGVEVRAAAGTRITATLMAINPTEFGKVAWFPAGLLPYHQNRFLNVLARNPQAALVSKAFSDTHGVALGDTILVTWEHQGMTALTVQGFVDWWPTYNPYDDGTGRPTELVVANLSWIQIQVGFEPYQVWLKLEPAATSAGLYRQLEDLRIPLQWLSDTRLELVRAKNDALLQGTNGALTLGFLVAMLVSTAGFLIYWIVSLQSRALQFGIFRAMGMSRLSVVGMMAFEQLFLSVVAVLAGVLIGGGASALFAPLLELTKSAAEHVPPLRSAAEARDYLRLIATVGLMLGAALSVIVSRVLRLRMTQALRLGEE